MVTVRPTHAQLVYIYEQLRAEGTLERVLQDENARGLDDFLRLAESEEFFAVLDDAGEVAAFWWATHFYDRALCFHGGALKGKRHLGLGIFSEALRRLFELGATDIFAFSERRDVALFLRRSGFKPVSTINKRITVWVSQKIG